jgi:branched-chain amino acid transport system permease protein
VIFVNQILQGVLLGGYYALLATGLALMFGVMRIINLAHGDLAILGAYLVFLLLEHWHVSPFIGILPVLPVMLLLGYVLQRTLLERSLRSGLLVPLLTTFGLSIVIQNLLEQGFSPDVRSLGQNAGSIATSSWQITSKLSISTIGALTLGVAIVIFGLLQWFLSRTQAGRQMRATAQDPDTAELVGIDSRAVYAWATAIAVAIAAIAGMFLAIRSTFFPYAGPDNLIFAFEAVVIGGLGSSLWGALLGGILLGVAQTIGGQINPEYSILAGHLVFLLVLASPRGGLLTLGVGGLRRARAARGVTT